ncbi:uncharacterized protein V6R79_011420 [Siganus canaliculatus]
MNSFIVGSSGQDATGRHRVATESSSVSQFPMKCHRVASETHITAAVCRRLRAEQQVKTLRLDERSQSNATRLQANERWPEPGSVSPFTFGSSAAEQSPDSEREVSRFGNVRTVMSDSALGSSCRIRTSVSATASGLFRTLVKLKLLDHSEVQLHAVMSSASSSIVCEAAWRLGTLWNERLLR